MQRCIELALQGESSVAPNPMVGALITDEQGNILTEAFHHAPGKPHAEVNAIAELPPHSDYSHLTLYVNLEPCAHHGRTPPCADLIINKGFKRVVVGSGDPNPLVSGQGIERMRKAGIEVVEHVLEKECNELNRKFMTYHREKRPYFTLKWAQTSDGFIGRHASQNHLEKKISNEASRKFVHELRAKHQAILIGANTANLDRPKLTVRYADGKDPVKIILSGRNNLDSGLTLLQEGENLVYNTLLERKDKHAEYIKLRHNRFDSDLMEDLYNRGIQSVLVEGGSQVLQWFIDHQLWDEAYVLHAPLKWETGIKAPVFSIEPLKVDALEDNQLYTYRRA